MKVTAGKTFRHLTLLTVIISISGCLPLAPIMAAKRMSDKSSTSSTDTTAKPAATSSTQTTDKTQTSKPGTTAAQ